MGLVAVDGLIAQIAIGGHEEPFALALKARVMATVDERGRRIGERLGQQRARFASSTVVTRLLIAAARPVALVVATEEAFSAGVPRHVQHEVATGSIGVQDVHRGRIGPQREPEVLAVFRGVLHVEIVGAGSAMGLDDERRPDRVEGFHERASIWSGRHEQFTPYRRQASRTEYSLCQVVLDSCDVITSGA